MKRRNHLKITKKQKCLEQKETYTLKDVQAIRTQMKIQWRLMNSQQVARKQRW